MSLLANGMVETALSEAGGCTKRDPLDPPQIGCIAVHLCCL